MNESTNPPTATEVLALLDLLFAAERLGVQMRVQEGQLQLGPKQRVTDELRRTIKTTSVRSLLVRLVQGDPSVLLAVVCFASQHEALREKKLAPTTVAALSRYGVELKVRDLSAYDEYDLLMDSADREYYWSKPKRSLYVRPGTLELDPWPPHETAIPFKKYRGKTLGAIAETYEGRDYLRWILDKEVGAADLREDIQIVLAEYYPPEPNDSGGNVVDIKQCLTDLAHGELNDGLVAVYRACSLAGVEGLTPLAEGTSREDRLAYARLVQQIRSEDYGTFRWGDSVERLLQNLGRTPAHLLYDAITGEEKTCCCGGEVVEGLCGRCGAVHLGAQSDFSTPENRPKYPVNSLPLIGNQAFGASAQAV